jgi:hypothetical protein
MLTGMSAGFPKIMNGPKHQIWVGLKVAKFVARMLATAALWDRIQTSLVNTKMSDISKGVAILLLTLISISILTITKA